MAPGDILDTILAKKREEIAAMPAPALGSIRPSTRDFCHFVSTQKQEVACIAEIKRATPFKGSIVKEAVEAGAWAAMYENAGAAAISVLTDTSFFQGSLIDLEAASAASNIPILRKDFVLDEKQIYEARLHGADAILLIARALDVPTLRQFQSVCRHLHMRALVEVHNESELEKALDADSEVIGINTRNLADGSIDLSLVPRLAARVPRERVLVAESGIETPADVSRLCGIVDAILVGTSLMRAKDPSRTLSDLVRAGGGQV